MEFKEVEQKKCFSRWYGWGSPFGLAVFILSCSVAVVACGAAFCLFSVTIKFVLK